MTTRDHVRRYEQLVGGSEQVESTLKRVLPELLNAEVGWEARASGGFAAWRPVLPGRVLPASPPLPHHPTPPLPLPRSAADHAAHDHRRATGHRLAARHLPVGTFRGLAWARVSASQQPACACLPCRPSGPSLPRPVTWQVHTHPRGARRLCRAAPAQRRGARPLAARPPAAGRAARAGGARHGGCMALARRCAAGLHGLQPTGTPTCRGAAHTMSCLQLCQACTLGRLLLPGSHLSFDLPNTRPRQVRLHDDGVGLEPSTPGIIMAQKARRPGARAGSLREAEHVAPSGQGRPRPAQC